MSEHKHTYEELVELYRRRYRTEAYARESIQNHMKDRNMGWDEAINDIYRILTTMGYRHTINPLLEREFGYPRMTEAEVAEYLSKTAHQIPEKSV